MKPGPLDPAELRRFLDTFLYREAAFLVDEIVSVDGAAHALEARLDTTRVLPFAREQRVDLLHPAHVSAGEILMATGLTLTLGYPLEFAPWLYPLYYVALLFPRQFFDDRRCAESYGPLWDEYCKRVPSRIIPGIY